MLERTLYFIKRNYFWVNFAAATVASVSASGLVAEAIASNLEGNQPAKVKVKANGQKKKSGNKFDRPSDYDNLLSGALLRDSMALTTGGEAVSVDGISLIGTVAGPQRVAAATVQLAGEKGTHEYGVGKKIGGLRLVWIAREKIILKNPGGERISIYVDGDKKPGTKKEVAATKKHGGVHTATFPRDELRRIVANPALIMKGIKMRPKKKGGKLVGYKVRRIKKDHLVYKLGARKGDVITRINGKDLNNPQDFLYLLQELDTLSQISIDLTRKKMPATYNVLIQ